MTGAWQACRAGGEAARRRQYRWELVGAALGLAVVGPVAVSWTGSLGAAWIAAGFAALGAGWVTLPRSDPVAQTNSRSDRWQRWLTIGTLLVAISGTVTTVSGHPPLTVPLLAGPGVGVHLRDVASKETDPTLKTHFSPWARTDWLRSGSTDMSWVFVEGRFVARSVAWDGISRRFPSARVEHLARLKRLQWRARAARDSALIVGAGAGFDVAVALQGGVKRVTAVELNQATIDFARADADRNGGVYDRAEVQVVRAEARRWLAQRNERFDHIQLALMETAPGGVRGRATAHSRLLTREAVALWRRHLHPHGVLALLFNTTSEWQTTAQQLGRLPAPGKDIDTRAGADAIDTDALDGSEGADSQRWSAYLWGARVPGAQSQADPFSHVLLYSPTPWTAAERAQLTTWAHAVGATDTSQPAVDQRGAPPPLLTDDRPMRIDHRRGSLALLFAAFAVALSLLLARRSLPLARPICAATIAGGALAWLQVVVVEWVSAATGAPALALGGAIAAMLLGAATGTIIPWRRRGVWAAAVAAMMLSLLLPRLVPFAATLPVWVATLMMTIPLSLLALPLGIPWLVALEQAATGEQTAAATEGYIVAADGLGAVAGAGTSGLLIAGLGVETTGFIASMSLVVAAILLVAIGSSWGVPE